MDLRVGIVGAAGRMGRALVRQVAATEGCVLVGATARPAAVDLGRDAGELAGIGACGVVLVDDPLPMFSQADAVLDFTTPSATVAHAELAAQAHCSHIVGTTGLAAEDVAALRRSARHTVIVRGANMSVGVNLVAALTRRVAAVLDADFDIEIVEMHHRMKVDAPSGTALLFGEAAAEGRRVALDDVAVRGRDGITGPRRRGDIGFAALRGGNVIGEHTVVFAADNERIELTHRAGDRAIFARGAVRAALWAHGRPPGFYGMAEVLGLGSEG